LRSGTQTLERGARLLRELAARGTVGWRLSDLARRCELDKGTAHRLLACFVRERLVRRRRGDRRYVPGPLLFELSLALPAYAAFQAAAARQLAATADLLDAYAFLCLRSGSDFVCAANTGGASAKALEHDVGLRRPLVVSAGGMAILVALPADEAAQVVAENLRRVKAAGEVRVKAIERMLRRSQAHGCGVHLSDIVPGVNTFAVAIRDAAGMPFASLSVAGRADELPLARLPGIVPTLEQAARDIAAQAATLLELV
jgi:DNA-binding IclR family transcriptional regulator